MGGGFKSQLTGFDNSADFGPFWRPFTPLELTHNQKVYLAGISVPIPFISHHLCKSGTILKFLGGEEATMMHENISL